MKKIICFFKGGHWWSRMLLAEDREYGVKYCTSCYTLRWFCTLAYRETYGLEASKHMEIVEPSKEHV